MNPWHLDDELLRRYRAGDTDLPLAASIESHLITCAACRRLTVDAVPPERLDRIWQRIDARMAAPPTILRRFWARVRGAIPVMALSATTFPRPSWRPLVALTAVPVLAVAIWLPYLSLKGGSRSPSTGTVAAASSSSDWGVQVPRPRMPAGEEPLTAADLPALARVLTVHGSGAAASSSVQACQLAPINRSGPFVATNLMFRSDHGGVAEAAIVVFRNADHTNLLDIYVVTAACTVAGGQLLAVQRDVPRALSRPGQPVV